MRLNPRQMSVRMLIRGEPMRIVFEIWSISFMSLCSLSSYRLRVIAVGNKNGNFSIIFHTGHQCWKWNFSWNWTDNTLTWEFDFDWKWFATVGKIRYSFRYRPRKRSCVALMSDIPWSAIKTLINFSHRFCQVRSKEKSHRAPKGYSLAMDFSFDRACEIPGRNEMLIKVKYNILIKP